MKTKKSPLDLFTNASNDPKMQKLMKNFIKALKKANPKKKF